MDNKNLASKESAVASKRVYQKPSLIIYGNIREITQAVAKNSANTDNAAHGNDKTS